MVIEGLFFGYFIVSPALMVISDRIHKYLYNYEMQLMIDSELISVTKVFRLEFLPWSLTFTLLSGIIAGFIGHYTVRINTIRDMETKKLIYQATHDKLTDLYNREAFVNQLDFQLHQRVNETALFFIDLDGFKQANDRYGHEAGDEVLNETASRLRKILRKSDFIGRYGGDEFVVIVGKDESKDYKTLANRILKSIAKPYYNNKIDFITCSVGIAISEDGESVDTLIKKADFAMYSAKSEGKNRYKFGPMST